MKTYRRIATRAPGLTESIPVPRIETQRIYRFLYVAWEQLDTGQRRHVRLGLTHLKAWQRTYEAILEEQANAGDR